MKKKVCTLFSIIILIMTIFAGTVYEKNNIDIYAKIDDNKVILCETSFVNNNDKPNEIVGLEEQSYSYNISFQYSAFLIKYSPIQWDVLNSPPTPPSDRPIAGNRALVSLSWLHGGNAPTSEWTYGCAATSAGMLFGYYDRTGYTNMYSGPTNGGVCPTINLGQGVPTNPLYPIPGSCHIIATENGLDGIIQRAHVDDYYISSTSPGPDPWVTGGWTEHTWGLCTADYLGTNQWKWDIWSPFDGNMDAVKDGSTVYSINRYGNKIYDPLFNSTQTAPCVGMGSSNPCNTKFCHGLKLFAESRGYTVITNYNQLTDTNWSHAEYPTTFPPGSGGFKFSDYKTEIDNCRPVLLHWKKVDGGHTMLGVGYDDTYSDPRIYFHDTWDNLVHYTTWNGTYTTDNYELRAVTVIHLAPIIDVTPPTISNVTAIPESTGTNGFINITCDVTDNVAVDDVWVNITYPDTTNVNVAMNVSEDTYYYNTTYIPLGTYTYYIWANDTAGNANTSDSYTFTITGYYTLTINTIGSGTVTKSPDQATYAYGTTVTLMAVSDTGWDFSHWSGDLTGSTNPDTITMTSDKTVTATFNELIIIDYIRITYKSGNEIPNQNISIGFNLTGYASAYNTAQGYVGDIPVNWSVTNNGSSANTSPLMGSSSTFYSGLVDGFAIWTIDDGNGHSDTVEFTIDSSLFSMILYEEWNLVTMPIENTWTAETLGENISGCNVVIMFNVTSQTFLTHVVGVPHDDFLIVDGVGYFVFCSQGSIVSMPDASIASVTVPIYEDWNLVGWYHDYSTTAEALGENISSTSVVIMFDPITQTFLTHVVDVPHDNFMVERAMGLFIYTSEASIWHGEG